MRICCIKSVWEKYKSIEELNQLDKNITKISKNNQLKPKTEEFIQTAQEQSLQIKYC